MNEQETTQTEVAENTPTPETVTPAKGSSVWKKYIIPVGVVAVIILGVLYLMEKEGRSKTNLFGGIIESQEANVTVAVVNGQKIKNGQLTTSIQQFTQVAVAQGIDVTSVETQEEIKDQALEVLINTELLKQDALGRGHAISDEDVSNRITEIETELGGEETLNDRMTTLGITRDQLQQDVGDELLIQLLLDEIFAEAEIVVTDEEIAEVYSMAGGEEAGLPSMEEVSEQVREQIVASKEQELIDNHLTELRTGAEIEIK
tara:strand:- start:7502 stop:8281 length:780 start_codon:yes stop_codon:yes gene_type:complete